MPVFIDRGQRVGPLLGILRTYLGQNGGQTGMGVLNKGTGMALQIQGFHRIVNHPLGRIHLEQIEFEGGQANFQGQG